MVSKPVPSADVRSLADEYSNIAKDFVSAELEIDIPLITRAVRYIDCVHGLPSGDDTRWFTGTLMTLLEVARPNAGVNDSARPFLKDMQDGIEQTMAD